MEGVGVAFIQAAYATQYGGRRYVVDGDGFAARQEGAIFVCYAHFDGAAGTACFTIGVGVLGIATQKRVFRWSKVFYRAISPVNAIARRGVNTRVNQCSKVEGVRAAFVYASITR